MPYPQDQQYQDPNLMNNRGLPSDSGRPYAQQVGPGYGMGMPPGMNYTGDNMQQGPPDMSVNSRETEELTSLKLDGLRTLDQLQKSWMGYSFDPNSNKWKKIAEPMISPLGVGRLIQIMSASTGNVDHRLSKWGSDSINESLLATRRNLRHDLMLNPIYRLDPNEPLPVSTIRIILEECYECKESLLKRSLDGFTVRETGHSETHQFVHNPNQQSGSFLPKIFR